MSDQRVSSTVWVLWRDGCPVDVFDDEADAQDAAGGNIDHCVVQYERVGAGEAHEAASSDGGDLWGYGDDMATVRERVQALSHAAVSPAPQETDNG